MKIAMAGLKAMLLEKAMAWTHAGGAFGLAHRRGQANVLIHAWLGPGYNLVHLFWLVVYLPL